MKTRVLSGILICVLLISVRSDPSFAAKPIWAQKAATFLATCDPDVPCTSLRIPSPDGRSRVDVTYPKSKGARQAELHVVSPGLRTRVVTAPCSNGDVELLWAPNSKAFFLNGGCGSAISGFYVYVYEVRSERSDLLDLTHKAKRDLIRSYPPCRAKNHDPRECQKMEHDDSYYNATGIDWVPGSSAMVVLTQIPCTSRYGGVMCSAMGYYIDIPTGNIRRRLTAEELKREWQSSMAWNFEIPDPPELESRKDAP